ncbi:MAG: OmpA family protein [Alphaproteobacteria bacterium]|nr:OmpA family protein [Alphaproteobacteria bacterium]
MSLKVVILAGLLLGVAGCAQDRLLLLPGKGQTSSGAVAVLTEKGETKSVIDRVYADARIGSGGVQQNTTDAAAVEKRHGALLEALPRPPETFLLYFKIGTVELQPKSRPELEKLFAEVRSRPGADVQVVGHTSTLGSVRRNDRLSFARAKEIAELLVQRGLDPSLVRAVGRGERELLVKTKDGVSNALNRRVEVLVR